MSAQVDTLFLRSIAAAAILQNQYGVDSATIKRVREDSVKFYNQAADLHDKQIKEAVAALMVTKPEEAEVK